MNKVRLISLLIALLLLLLLIAAAVRASSTIVIPRNEMVTLRCAEGELSASVRQVSVDSQPFAVVSCAGGAGVDVYLPIVGSE